MLIVEDGTGKADAVVYCSLEFANAWHLARGITLWATLTDAEKESALVRAAQYMQQVYRLRWHGYRRFSTQALDWPRGGVPVVDGPTETGYYSDTSVPVEVQQANAELAFKAAFEDLSPDLARTTVREKVDVLEVEYVAGGVPYKRFRAVDNLLAPLLRGSSAAAVLVRS